MSYQKTLCLDFDGVIHSYTSGWSGADVVTDPPVDGALDFIRAAVNRFKVAIYSSRSGQMGGVEAMEGWLLEWGLEMEVLEHIDFPADKPAAWLTIDDRGWQFHGLWPEGDKETADLLDTIDNFKPWNKRDAAMLRLPG